MKIAPFTIKQLKLDTARLRVQSHPVTGPNDPPDDVFPGYFVVSTAPPNIEEAKPPTEEGAYLAKRGIEAIARDLHRIQQDPTIDEPAELMIAVHGYNTEVTNVRAWYSDIYRYIAQDDKAIRRRRNLVFIGYRWSSERLSFGPKHLWANLRALPNVPQAILALGISVIAIAWGWTLFYGPIHRLPVGWLDGWLNTWWGNLLAQGLFSGAIAFTVMILTLFVLRLSAYFRDVYRALNFGVPDLTELIRQIDQAVIDLRVDDLYKTYETPSAAFSQATAQAAVQAKQAATGKAVTGQKPPQKIQLNFLGHSMGGLVITNVVRILSDVFDTRSIRQTPTPEIGHTLSLGRLILASPDIPVLSIISSRANGLASSLRRFNEAYLFSNEGDLALRLASTAVNYISFPSASQHHGHRLGSIALTNSKYKKGIINLPSLREHYPIERPLNEAVSTDPDDILKCLFITHSSGTGDGYLSLSELFKLENQAQLPATLADLFTFLDCTDYRDYRLSLKPNGMRDRSEQAVGLLTRAKNRRHLRLWDYFGLVIDSIAGRRDVHGGYFQGEYSRQLIYRLAFLGGSDGLAAVANEASQESGRELLSKEDALDAFDQRCMDKGIQVYLSPLRYRVDVQGADLYQSKCEMLQLMDTEKSLLDAPSPQAQSQPNPSTQDPLPDQPPSPKSVPLAG